MKISSRHEDSKYYPLTSGLLKVQKSVVCKYILRYDDSSSTINPWFWVLSIASHVSHTIDFCTFITCECSKHTNVTYCLSKLTCIWSVPSIRAGHNLVTVYTVSSSHSFFWFFLFRRHSEYLLLLCSLPPPHIHSFLFRVVLGVEAGSSGLQDTPDS